MVKISLEYSLFPAETLREREKQATGNFVSHLFEKRYITYYLRAINFYVLTAQGTAIYDPAK